MARKKTDSTAKFKATLVRGEKYVYGGKTWTKDDPAEGAHIISAKEKEHLEVHGVDTVTVMATPGEPAENIEKSKFTYEEVEDTAVEGTGETVETVETEEGADDDDGATGRRRRGVK